MIEIKPQEKITNADRIRSMTDEELAEFLSELSSHCYECGDSNGLDCYYKNEECQNFRKWLESEVSNEDN